MEFRVKALDREQAVLAQHVDAIDETDARRQLGLLGLRVISLTPVRQARLFARPGKIPLVIFSQELVSLLDAGLSLVESMEALTEKEETAAVRRPLEQILSRLYEGQTLGAALAEHPTTFPYLFVATVRASERTGSLREAITRFITYQQQIDSLRKTLVNAIGYGLTRRSTRAAIGTWFAKLPAIGRQVRLYQLARLYRTVGMLLRSGMPAVTAMNMSSGLLSETLRPAFSKATQSVREGQSIANAMEQADLTTPVAARMLRVGERSGNMGEMTERIAAFYDDEIGRWVAIVTRLIEPLFMTVIGLLIGVIVVLMYFPIFQLAGSVQ